MDKEQIEKIMNNLPENDEAIKDDYFSMIRDAFVKELRWAWISLWIWFFVFLVPIILSAVFFFMTDQVQYQIMCAAIFVCCWLSVGCLKIYFLVILQKHRISREVKRLELRVAELTEVVKSK